MQLKIKDESYNLNWEYENEQLNAALTEKGISLEEAKKMKTKDLMKTLGLSHMPAPSVTNLVVICENTKFNKVFSVKNNFGKSKPVSSKKRDVINSLFPGKNNKCLRNKILSMQRKLSCSSKEEARKVTLDKFLSREFPGKENKSIRSEAWDIYLAKNPKKIGIFTKLQETLKQLKELRKELENFKTPVTA